MEILDMEILDIEIFQIKIILYLISRILYLQSVHHLGTISTELIPPSHAISFLPGSSSGNSGA